MSNPRTASEAAEVLNDSLDELYKSYVDWFNPVGMAIVRKLGGFMAISKSKRKRQKYLKEIIKLGEKH